ncbi:unnamed protein product [Penicillium pancosmium]
MLATLKETSLYQDLNWRLVLIGFTASLGAMGFGFDNGWWGGALGLSEFQHKYGAYNPDLDQWAIPPDKTSVGTETGSAGIILGCILAPIITSRLGRKMGFMALSCLTIVGIILEASAVSSFLQLAVGRIIVYSGIELASNVVPTYLSECSSQRVRETITQEIEMLRVQIEEQRELHKATTVLDCFKGTNLRRTIAAMGVQILQQAQGVSFIQNFIVTFMQQMGFPDPLKTNVLVTGCSFVCHIITFVTFDKLGRRNSLFLGSVGLAATMLGTGGAIESSPSVADLSSLAKNACAALLILWYCIYGFTWGPGCWIVTGEIGTGKLRERTVFLASMGSFLTSVPINFVNPYVQSAIGGRVTFIYGAFSVVSLLFVWICVPETSRRSLEELDEMFQNKVPTWQFDKYVCSGIGAEITKLEHSELPEQKVVKVEVSTRN